MQISVESDQPPTDIDSYKNDTNKSNEAKGQPKWTINEKDIEPLTLEEQGKQKIIIKEIKDPLVVAYGDIIKLLRDTKQFKVKGIPETSIKQTRQKFIHYILNLVMEGKKETAKKIIYTLFKNTSNHIDLYDKINEIISASQLPENNYEKLSELIIFVNTQDKDYYDLQKRYSEIVSGFKLKNSQNMQVHDQQQQSVSNGNYKPSAPPPEIDQIQSNVNYPDLYKSIPDQQNLYSLTNPLYTDYTTITDSVATANDTKSDGIKEESNSCTICEYNFTSNDSFIVLPCHKIHLKCSKKSRWLKDCCTSNLQVNETENSEDDSTVINKVENTSNSSEYNSNNNNEAYIDYGNDLYKTRKLEEMYGHEGKESGFQTLLSKLKINSDPKPQQQIKIEKLDLFQKLALIKGTSFKKADLERPDFDFYRFLRENNKTVDQLLYSNITVDDWYKKLGLKRWEQILSLGLTKEHIIDDCVSVESLMRYYPINFLVLNKSIGLSLDDIIDKYPTALELSSMGLTAEIMIENGLNANKIHKLKFDKYEAWFSVLLLNSKLMRKINLNIGTIEALGWDPIKVFQLAEFAKEDIKALGFDAIFNRIGKK